MKSRASLAQELVARYETAGGAEKPGASLRDLLSRDIRPYLQKRASAVRDDELNKAFKRARMELPAAAQSPIDQLERICHEARQLRAQQRLHWVLHGWLFVHVPLSMGVLLLLTVVHIVMALRFSF